MIVAAAGPFCFGSSASSLGQIMAVCPGDALDHAEVQQSAQMARQPARGAIVGTEVVKGLFTLNAAANNLVRLPKLLTAAVYRL